ncbi:LemA family protein [Thermanaerovibrio acidaminovorans DSM 6589]|uniref:LemA family protein n=2 Tax=Thermanaerovibrio TaxID=81461 RepID=D1B8Z6_THEAS|nr:LemA family protein [Thermanaerovibrio acidaminovorans]ACZ18749.1 LemA family protein [Thermanaerovibrio acidaminovorans DSM 6589]
MVLLIALGVLGVLLLWFLGIYNRFVKLRNMVDEAWSGVDVQLKRRWDLVGNLVETVKGYAAHEREIFEEVARLRNQLTSASSVSERAQVENGLTQTLRTLFAVAEAYPQLRASENFTELQRTLGELENDIQLARRYYNGTVRDYNIMVDAFPSLLVARMMGYGKRDFFQLEDPAERSAPRVSFS